MAKLICVNDNEVAWVESDAGDVFGIVSPSKILDCDGIPHPYDDALTVLERNGFQLDQDWENESTYIDFRESNGETSRLVFCGDSVTITSANGGDSITLIGGDSDD